MRCVQLLMQCYVKKVGAWEREERLSANSSSQSQEFLFLTGEQGSHG